MNKGVKRVFKAAVFGTLLLSIALAGCATSPASEGASATEAVAATESAVVTEAVVGPKVGGTMVINLNANPDTLDPQKSNFGVMDAVMSRVGASLVAMDINGKIIPYLAESWEASADGLSWTFHLKQGVKFHNGDSVTAQDWVFTLERMLDPEFASPNASMVAPITSVEATDDYTLVIHTKEPFFPLLDTLAIPSYLGVWSKRAVEEGGDKYGASEVGTVGAGPYIFKEWVQDEKIIIQRNPEFTWGPVYYEGCSTGPYYIDTIEFRIIPDYSTTLAGLDSGDLNYADLVGKDVASVESLGTYTINSVLTPGWQYLEFNLSKAPLDNEIFRQAINYAIDRDTIVQIVYGGQAQKELAPISPAMIGYDPVVETAGLDYNVEKAKEFFQQAGYTYDADGILLNADGTPVVLTVLSTAEENTVKIAQLLVAQLKAVGIDLKIETMEWGAMAAKLSAGEYEMDLMGIGWPDFDVLTVVYHSSSKFWNFINDPEVDRLLELTRTTTDPVEQQKAVNAAVMYLTEHAYSAPLAVPMSFSAISNNITGYKYSAYTGMTLADTYFTDLP